MRAPEMEKQWAVEFHPDFASESFDFPNRLGSKFTPQSDCSGKWDRSLADRM
jgi:hypothetical protein